MTGDAALDGRLTDRQLLTWLEERQAPGVPTNTMVAAFRIRPRDELDPARLEQAFASVVRRSDALRTVFEERRGGVRQRVRDDLEARLELVDCSRGPDPEAAWRRWFDGRRQRPFRLGERAFDSALVRLGRDEVVWYLGLHHLITDATSFALIYEATLATYVRGETPPLPAFAESLAHAARLRDSPRHAAATEFWGRRLSDPPEPVRFYGRLDPRLTARSRRRRILLGRDRLEALRAVASRGRGTLAGDQPLLAAFIALAMAWVHRMSGCRRIGVGTTLANRPSRRFRDTIGLLMEAPHLRAELAPGESFASLLDRVRLDLYQVLPHSRTAVSNPLRRRAFEVLVNLQTVRFPSRLGPTRTELGSGTVDFEAAAPVPAGHASAASAAEPVAISVHDFDDEGEPALDLDLKHDVFDRDGCDRAASHFERLLDACLAEPGRPLECVDLLSPSERRRVLVDFNEPGEAPEPDDARGRTVIDLFEEAARRAPRATAVVFGDRSLDYATLARRVEALGSRLRRLGLGPEERVAVRLERSIEMLVALLAIWKAGAAYVPLDPAQPPERCAQILEDAAPALLLTSRALQPPLQTGPELRVVDLGELCSAIEAEGARAGADLDRLPADRLAYVIFTSGSTGRPKGVEITHGSLLGFLLAMRARPGLAAGDRVLALSTIAFDISMLELFLPLVVGATVDLVDTETRHDARRLRAKLERDPLTVVQATPATWRLLVEAGWRGSPDLRVLCGAETLEPALARQLLERAAEVWNVYGPTETTVWATAQRVLAAGGSIPIGRPIAGATAYVLGPDLVPLPIGVIGELYLGGTGVARGYRGRPDLTRERFVPDPFSSRPGARLYRTGDLASWSADGVLRFHGRTDRQVKVRGHRVEPGEIEAALGAVPGVRQVLVVARGEPGREELAAYWTGEAEAAALRQRARAALPDYMVPSGFMRLPAFPLTATGKIDHAALPDLVPEAEPDGTPPRDATEERIAAIWSEVLGRSPIPVDRDFFALGGTSIKVLETRARVEEAFGVELPLGPFFEAPATVAALAARLAAPARESLVLLERGRDEAPPVFLVHAADGALLPYANLARRLGGDRRVYGLQPQSAAGLPMVHTRVAEMAAHYVAAVREAQPRGPYVLGGLCAGAVIACEMARLLEADDEEVRLVLFDAADRAAPRRPHLYMRRRVDRLRETLAECNLRKLPLVLGRKLRGFTGFEWRRHRSRAQARLALAAIRLCHDRGLSPPGWVGEVPLTTLCTLALEGYRPSHQVREEILLFRATDGIGSNEPFSQVYADPLLGWESRSAKGVRCIDVPGGHQSMLQEPCVAVLAERLRACLRAA